MASGTPLPPPPPGSHLDGGGSSPVAQRVLAVVAVVGLASAAIMTMLWLSERDRADDAIAGRSDARPEVVDSSDDERDELQDELDRTRAELDDALAELDETNRILAEALAGRRSDSAGDETGTETDDATVSDSDVDDDAAGADAATEADTEPEADDEETEPDDGTDTGADDPEVEGPADEVAPIPTPLEIGTQLGGLYRSNVLGIGQRRCLGEAVTAALGPDLMTILGGEDPGSDERLVQALLGAADPCGIEPSALFGPGGAASAP